MTTNLQEKIWGPGHGFAFNLKDTDEWIFVYLEYGIGGTSRQVYAARMEFNEDGTIKPLKLDRKGVGPLAKVTQPKRMDLSKATVTVSSFREPLTLKPRRWGNAKELCYQLPDSLPVRTHTFQAENVIDRSNFTEWWASPDDSQKWWQIDLGKPGKVNRCEIFFAHPTLGHAYIVEKSPDAKTWQTVREQKTRDICSPQVIDKIGKARFLRVKILEGTPAIWEVKIY